MRKKLIVVGWGRMGITHLSIVNGLYPMDFDVTIVEPNRFIAVITRSTLGYKVVNSLDQLDLRDTIVIIATPPAFHSQLCRRAIDGGALSVFVEKPFGLFDKRVLNDRRIVVGYVLRFTEVVQALRRIIEVEGCKRLELNFNSSTLSKKAPSGWRNSIYGGVLNEMGSHIIDMFFYLLGDNEFNINESIIKSVYSDFDDIVFVRGNIGETEVEMSLNWTNAAFRKPVWSGTIQTERRKLNFDQQSIESGIEVNSVGYYVRGREFSLQMTHFIEQNHDVRCDSEQANKIHEVILKIKNNI